MNRDFERITVVSVTGLQATVPGAMQAIIKSCIEMPGARGMLVCPEKPVSAPAWLQHVPIQPFGYLEYGIFVLYVLSHFIETDFALIVQDDGWVVDGRNWRPEFLDWDIIGAPVHIAQVTGPGGSAYYQGFEWERLLDDPNVEIRVVYNGGFTLRSKRLLSILRECDIPLVVPPVARIEGPPWSMHWDANVIYEDIQLCTVMRSRLEEHGIRFAPLELARDFGIEHSGTRLHHSHDFGRLLGHHSKFRKIVSAEPCIVRYTISRHQALQIHGEDRVIGLFESLGTKIEWPPET